MPDNLLGGQGATLLTAIIIVAVALLALVGVFWLIRNRAASTFIRGGKNRQPRLAVLDATAVDTRRRLVLIRRDDVEHLVMIGGPTDIVIESRIARHDDLQATPAAQPRQQRAAPPAAEPVRPARAAAAPTQAAQHPVERPVRPADTARPDAAPGPAAAGFCAAGGSIGRRRRCPGRQRPQRGGGPAGNRTKQGFRGTDL
jgi:flagellar biogenesis protein FliO